MTTADEQGTQEKRDPATKADLLLWLGMLGICLLSGCEGRQEVLPHLEARDVLFRGDGEEIVHPSFELGSRLYAASPRGERHLVAEVGKLLETSRGYARLAAARALLRYSYVGEAKYFTRGAFDAIARNWVRLAKPKLRASYAYRSIASGVHSWPNEPMDLAFELVIDGQVISLREEADPTEGWGFRDPRIYLDGKKVFEYSGVFYEGGVYLPLGNLLKSRDQLVGEHTWRCEVTVLGPRGMCRRIAREFPFNIVEEWRLNGSRD